MQKGTILGVNLRKKNLIWKKHLRKQTIKEKEHSVQNYAGFVLHGGQSSWLYIYSKYPHQDVDAGSPGGTIAAAPAKKMRQTGNIIYATELFME